jgi:TraY domain
MAAKEKVTARRRPGRPVSGSEGKYSSFTFRLTTRVRRELEKLAKASGRSLSEEAQRRIEIGLLAQHALPSGLDLAFGYQTSALLLLIGDLEGAGERLELDWINDPAKFADMRGKVDLLFDTFAPYGPPAEMSPETAAAARQLLHRLLAKAPHPLYKDWARERCLRLGDTAVTRAMLRLEDRS